MEKVFYYFTNPGGGFTIAFGDDESDDQKDEPIIITWSDTEEDATEICYRLNKILESVKQ